MRRALLLSLSLTAALPMGVALAQITPTPQPFPPQTPAPTAATPGGVGAGVPAVTSTPAPIPSAGMPLPASVIGNDAAFSQNESALQKQVELLKLQAQIADLHKKINDADHPAQATVTAPLIAVPPRAMDAQASTDASGSSTTTVAQVNVPPSRHTAALTSESTLRLSGLLKIGNAAQATILDHGESVRVSVGSTLPSGWTVVSIEDSSVQLRRGRVHRRLTIGG